MGAYSTQYAGNFIYMRTVQFCESLQRYYIAVNFDDFNFNPVFIPIFNLEFIKSSRKVRQGASMQSSIVTQ